MWFLVLGLAVVAVASGSRKKSSAAPTGPVGSGGIPGGIPGGGGRGAVPGGLGSRPGTATIMPGLITPIISRPDLTIPMAPMGEKFEDPFYACLGSKIADIDVSDEYLQPATGSVEPYTIYPNVYGIPSDLGQKYLRDAPNNAAARIAAIRAKIGPRPQAKNLFSGKLGIDAIAEASFQNLQKLSNSIVSTYQDAKNYADIAEKFGVPVSQVTAEAKDILGSLGKSQAEFIETAAKYRPVASAIITGVQQYVQTGTFSATDAIMVVGSALAAVAGSVVPIIGQVINFAVQLGVADLEARNARGQATCKLMTDEVNETIKLPMAENFPYLFHLIADSGGPNFCGGHPTRPEMRRMEFLTSLGWGSYLAFRGLAPDDKTAVQRWWSTAVQLMSHPEVYNVFQKLGHGYAFWNENLYANSLVKDKYGRTGPSFYGGALASDEQVMMVAAPIAVANGFDVDDFARRLWNRSKGWRDANPSSFQYLPKGYHWAYNDTGDPYDTKDRWSCGPDLVSNAWWLQWAVLARDAFKLAEEMRVKTLNPPPTGGGAPPASGEPPAPPRRGGGILDVIGR